MMRSLNSWTSEVENVASICIRTLYLLLDRRPCPEQVCIVPASSVCVLDFLQVEFHNTSPGDYEDVFIKAGDSETRTGLAQKKQ